MVPIPSGTFKMGSNHHYPEEKPEKQVSVDQFLISQSEVTNEEFKAFVDATGYVTTAEKPLPADLYPDLPDEYRVPGGMVFIMPKDVSLRPDPSTWWIFTPGANWRQPKGPGSTIDGRGSEPVTQVSWQDAIAFAKWRGHDLPTEAEWEWAARGGSDTPSEDFEPEANIWEGVFPIYDAAIDGYNGVAPVGCYKPNGFGLYDMIGNVWELTSDAYDTSKASETSSIRDPNAPQQKVIKGGSWLCSKTYCARYRPSSRQPEDADLGTSHIGFRTILRIQ